METFEQFKASLDVERAMRERIILVTGSRKWTDRTTMFFALVHYGPGTVLHGDAMGADDIAAGVAATDLFWPVQGEPPDYATHSRTEAPKVRNQKMVDMLTPERDVVLAFPLPGSRGTWDCVNKAKARGLTVHIIKPGWRPPGWSP